MNTSKTKEIVFRRPSLRHYEPPTPIVQIEQVEEVKLLSVMLTSTLSANLHLKNVIDIINQHLYVQLRRLGLDITGVVEVFLSVLVEHFLYALPVFSGTITANDINRINSVLES